ncbi:MAG: glycosyltransferase family 4 protein, partial [Anaerolineales bacterium]|nr:glycosyltransferase family 4 protein [Anaerolineales bacterium]
TFTHDSNILGLPLAWLAGIPARVGTHLGEIRGMSAWRERLHTTLINYGIIQALIASSSRTRQNAIQRGVQPERIKVIFNAITPFDLGSVNRNSIRQKLSLQEDDIFLLSVGRLVYEKGHEFLVKAMSSVVQSPQNIVAGICGAGPLYNSLQGEIVSLSLEEKVMLLGQWENLLELLASADIFVLPSRWEGLPMALLEAMMAGLPVVATRVEGVEEVVEDGVHGLLVPPENPVELAKAILQLSNAPELRRRMGEAAKQHILNSFTTDHMCQQYLDVMRKYIGEDHAD